MLYDNKLSQTDITNEQQRRNTFSNIVMQVIAYMIAITLLTFIVTLM